jgi:hypothetical protein
MYCMMVSLLLLSITLQPLQPAAVLSISSESFRPSLFGCDRHPVLLGPLRRHRTSTNWNSLGAKLLNGGIGRSMWPMFYCTQQSYMPPFENWKSFGSLLSSQPHGFVWIKKVSCVRGVLIRARGCRVGLPLPAIHPSKVSAKFCSFCSKRSERYSTFSWHAVAIISFIQALVISPPPIHPPVQKDSKQKFHQRDDKTVDQPCMHGTDSIERDSRT